MNQTSRDKHVREPVRESTRREAPGRPETRRGPPPPEGPGPREWMQGRWPEADGAYQQGHGYGAFDDDEEGAAGRTPAGGLGIRHSSRVVTSPLPARPSFKGRGPRNYARSDARIREHVCDALTDSDRVDATDIEVSVEDAEVTLTGSVPERAMKRAAEIEVEDCRGVQHVTNLLRVPRSDASSG